MDKRELRKKWKDDKRRQRQAKYLERCKKGDHSWKEVPGSKKQDGIAIHWEMKCKHCGLVSEAMV